MCSSSVNVDVCRLGVDDIAEPDVTGLAQVDAGSLDRGPGGHRPAIRRPHLPIAIRTAVTFRGGTR